MINPSFESDEQLLLEIDYITSKSKWFNVWVKSAENDHEVWITEWDIQNNISFDRYSNVFSSPKEAAEYSLKLARSLNLIFEESNGG